MSPRCALAGLALGAACLALGCASSPLWVGRSPDRRTRVEVTGEGSLYRLVIDADAPRLYDEIPLDRLAWTTRGPLVPARRDEAWWIVDGARERGPFVAVGALVVSGEHAAFAAQDADGWHVTVDDRRGPAFDAIEGTLQLDAERGSVAYVVTRGGREHAVHDDALGPPCTLVALATLGAKGRMLAYVDRGARDRLLVDDREVGTFERVLELVVAPDEPHWAAIVSEGETSVLLHDGVRLDTAPYFTHVRLSDDGAHVAYLAPAADGASIEVRLDGGVFASHRRVDGQRLGFVPGEGRLLLVYEDNQGMRVSIGGVESERYEAVEGPVTAPQRAGFVGRRGEHSEVVIEGVVVATEAWAGTLSLPARGDGYAYVARVGEERFVVTPRGRWPVPRLFVDTLVLDEEGRHWAALVPEMSARRLEIWVDGERSAVLDDHELGGAIAIDASRTLREIVRAVVAGELARALAEHH